MIACGRHAEMLYVLAHRPYRFADGVDVVVRRPDQAELLLPHSLAPAIRAGSPGE